MKALVLATLLVTSAAFAGTEVSDLPIKSSAEYFKSDVSNFRVTSVTLNQDPIHYVDNYDQQCIDVANSGDGDAEVLCHHYTYTYKPVVHVAIEFDSSAGQYDDGGNVEVLSIPQDQFTAAELKTISDSNQIFSFDHSAARALVKLAVESYVEQAQTIDYAHSTFCPDDDDMYECGYAHIVYMPVNVDKVRVTAQHAR